MAKKERKKNATEGRPPSPMTADMLIGYAKRLEGYAAQYREVAEKMNQIPVLMMENKPSLDLAMDNIFRAAGKAMTALKLAEEEGLRKITTPEAYEEETPRQGIKRVVSEDNEKIQRESRGGKQ